LGYVESGSLTLFADEGLIDVVVWPLQSGGLPPVSQSLLPGTQVELNVQSSFVLMPGAMTTASASSGAQLLVLSVVDE
jgi:hypothetical protein